MVSRATKKSSGCSSCGQFFFFSIFFAVGVAITWFLSIAPMLKAHQAKNWQEVDCVVRRIEVKVHSGKSRTYSPEVRFDYNFAGQPYTSDRFWFGTGSYGNRRSIEEAIAPYQAGGEYRCHVNPRKPSEAVLVPRVASHSWLGWLFGGIFGGVGAVAMIGTLVSYLSSNRRQRRDNAGRGEAMAPGVAQRRAEVPFGEALDGAEYDFDPRVCPMEEQGPDEPVILKTKGSRLATAVGSWLFAIIWNGISWTVGYFILNDFQWFAALIFLPFGLLGLAMILFAAYSTLQLWNPTTTLVCSQRHLYPGSEFEVSWLYQRGASRIAALSIDLQGEESVTYRQGTTTRTEKHVFFQRSLIQTSEASQIAKGFAMVALPEDAMHTFESGRNSVTWQLSVHGKIRFWPDLCDVFAITIYPPPVADEGAEDVAH